MPSFYGSESTFLESLAERLSLFCTDWYSHLVKSLDIYLPSITILTYLVSLHKTSPYFHVWWMSFCIVRGIVMQHTVRSLIAMLIMKRLRAVRAWELRTTTQQTLKLVNMPTIIIILKDKMRFSVDFRSVFSPFRWCVHILTPSI